jgi:uncharacterized membrane protein
VSETSQEKETTRLEAFSDGVFAIAITLLILDVHVPRPPDDPAEPFDLAHKLLALWSPLLAYFMSFASILVMWVNHHRIFTIVRRTDQAFLFWNGLLLMLVTFVPFPTSLLSEYMTHGGRAELRLAALVYAAHGTLIALAFTALWRYATKNGRLLTPGHMEDDVRRLSAQYWYGPLGYFVALVTAYFWPWGSIGICLAFVLFFSFSGLAGRN